MNLLTQNSKLQKSGKTYAFGIPAGLTCPNMKACAVGCYAKAGFYVAYPSVLRAQKARYELTQGPHFIELMKREIQKIQPDRVRIHDSGDFWSETYLRKWIVIMEHFPRTIFYSYSKMINLLKSHPLPQNFTPIFSYGGKEDYLIDPTIHRHSKVFRSVEDLRAAKYANASHDDRVALGQNHRIGLVFHGPKSKMWGEQQDPKEV